LAHIVDHVSLGLHQKACGFVQCCILSCLRGAHLSGIELLTDLRLSPWIASSVRVLVACALRTHLHVVLLVVELSVAHIALRDALDNLWLLNVCSLHARVVVLNLF